MAVTDHSETFRGGPTGFLLIHGLGGTPVEMRFVGIGLARAGFTVSCPQLAGHCGSFEDLRATRWRDWYASGEGSYFKGKHELKFGSSWRKTTLDSYSSVPGNSIVTFHDGYPNMIAVVWSDSKLLTETFYNSLWFGDTISLSRLVCSGDRIGSLTSMPAFSSTRTTAVWPSRTASRNALYPDASRYFGSAPAWSNASTTSA